MDRICCIGIAVMLVLSVCLYGIVEAVRGDGSHAVAYEEKLFDQSRVHTIEIFMDGWDELIANATAEEYMECDIVIDGERINNVGIRAKGNTSLSTVATLGSQRYSFKVEFDHYVKGRSYQGLDKLSLNNLIQDATMMKDYLAYTLMDRMGVPVSQCSYAMIYVNGEAWGLYLAVEAVEDSFLDRNGMSKGDLYKPDSLSFGGGRGNGRDFDIEEFRVEEDEEKAEPTATAAAEATPAPEASAQANDAGGSSGGQSAANDNNGDGASAGNTAQGGDFAASSGDRAQGGDFAASSGDRAEGDDEGFGASGGEGGAFGGFNFGMGSDDVKLVYTDDDPDSYYNIFGNAKTDVTKKDKARLIESLRKLNAKEDLDNVVNKDEVINYLVVHNFVCNDDSYTGSMIHNYYLYEENGKLQIIPWDYNLGFGGFASSNNATSTVNSPIDNPVTNGTTESRPLIAWIFTDEEAYAQYHETYSRFLEENVENGWLESEIARVREMIASYVENDPTAFYSVEAFNKAVDTMTIFCNKRGESIRGQLEGTIPATSAGQQRSNALIDASDIATSDMGSMNSGNGGGMPGGDNDGEGGSGGGSASDDGDSFGGSAGGSSGESATPNDAQTQEAPATDTAADGTEASDGAQAPEGVTLPEGTEASDGAQAPDATAAPAETAATEAPAARADDNGTQGSDGGPSGGGQANGNGGGWSAPGGDFGGTGSQQSSGFPWLQLVIYTVAILAALLLLRRVRAHN